MSTAQPSIAAEQVGASRIEFNVSHTDGLVVMAVARERAIGVDVENVSTQRAALEIADRFFAPLGVEALRALPGVEQPPRFFEYWTLKESYIKARGAGLDPAGQVPVPVVCRRGWTVDRRLDRGRFRRPVGFRQLRPDHEYLAAVCVASDVQAADFTGLTSCATPVMHWTDPMSVR